MRNARKNTTAMMREGTRVDTSCDAEAGPASLAAPTFSSLLGSVLTDWEHVSRWTEKQSEPSYLSSEQKGFGRCGIHS